MESFYLLLSADGFFILSADGFFYFVCWLVVHAGAQDTDFDCQVLGFSDCAFVFCIYVVACVVQGFASLDRRSCRLLFLLVRYSVISFVCSVAEMFDAFIVRHSARSP